MNRPKVVDYAVAGALARAAKVARTHGRFAMGSEAKVMAEFIATEIEGLEDELIGWEEKEANAAVRARSRALERGRQGDG